MAREYERVRRLAKALAVMEGENVKIWRYPDGTFGFLLAREETDKTIVEYITPY